jgi:hypothetical protein
MMKSRAWGAVALMVTAACGSSKGGGTGGTTSTTTTTTTVGTGTGGTGGTGGAANDPICLNPNATLSDSCASCLNALTSSESCINTFLMQCKANAVCLGFVLCTDGCHHDTPNGTGGAGGGALACAKGESTGGMGGASPGCLDCCASQSETAVVAYNAFLINDCVCTAGAPCASACAQ